jgi:hypothetical protein
MVAYELTAAIFASVILFSLVLFTIPGYVRAVAMGALDFYGGLHHSIVSFCAPVVITPLSYFSDHLPAGNLHGRSGAVHLRRESAPGVQRDMRIQA